MPTSPSTSFATLRPDLRDTLMEFDLAADQAGFVGLRIAPSLEVEKPFGQYGKVVLKEMLKQRDTRRAADGSYAFGSGKGTKDTYVTEAGLVGGQVELHQGVPHRRSGGRRLDRGRPEQIGT